MRRRTSSGFASGVSLAGIEDSDSDPDEDRAHMLVGRFMSHWSLLEFSLNEAVWTLLGVDHIAPAVALGVNMTMREKINFVRTCLNHDLEQQPELPKTAAKVMDRIGDRNGDRNIVAHNGFDAHPKGVAFKLIKAKGRLSAPVIVWTVADFEQKSLDMMNLSDALRSLADEAVKHRTPHPLPLGEQPLPQPPTQETGPRGFWDFLLPQHPEDPDFPPTTGETDPQNDPSRQG